LIKFFKVERVLLEMGMKYGVPKTGAQKAENAAHKKFGHLRTYQKDSLAVQTYIGVAEQFEREGNYLGALENYREAAHHARPEDRGALDEVIDRLEEGLKGVKDVKFAFAILSMASLLGALFFISSSLTGFAVASSYSLSNGISLILFFSGLLFAFLYVRSKNKNGKNVGVKKAKR
jgi:hypothetical protein